MRKLTLEDDYSVVTIEDKTNKVGVSDAIQQCRYALGATGYSQDNISALMPDEHELDKIVSDAVEAQKVDDQEMIRFELDAIDEKCRLWQKHGYKHITKDKMLDIIRGMTKLGGINQD